jgi:hypothetical protein
LIPLARSKYADEHRIIISFNLMMSRNSSFA